MISLLSEAILATEWELTLPAFLEIEAFTFAIVLVLYVSFLRRSESMLDDRLFKYVLLAVAAEIVIETVSRCLQERTFGGAALTWSLRVIVALFYSLEAVCCFFWLRYADCKLGATPRGLKIRTFLYLAPTLAVLVLSVGSIWTNWVFTISDANVFTRGNQYTDALYFSANYICLAMLVYIWVRSLICAKKATTKRERKEALLVGSFMYLPLIGAFLQVQPFAQDIPLLWTTTVLSLLIIFITIQSSKISQDSLTLVYNNSMLTHYLSQAYSKLDNENSFVYLILIDVDGFKKFNQTFGREEGDKALVQIAGILKEVSSPKNLFLARYESDKFAIAFTEEMDDKAEEIISEVQQRMSKENEDANKAKGYSLRLAIGYSKLGAGFANGPDLLISTADTQMYLNKRAVVETVSDKKEGN
ncbi:MAG: GGDEF domain-containing protein [Bacilli bacterium]|jgi:diguanylate cyclase (GGDEF)-like protein|nr:GGDEF domain-containing protein [Bacilli bacterium]